MIGLALALALAAPPADVACPPGAERRGDLPPEGRERWCEGKDPYGRPRREGPARTWYDDGAPWTEGSFTEGRRSGPFVEYHRNGRKAREGRYAADAKDGAWTTWSEAGAVEELATFVKGVLHGPFESFHPSGARRATGRYCGGAQCGRWTTWGADGRELGTADFGEQAWTPPP